VTRLARAVLVVVGVLAICVAGAVAAREIVVAAAPDVVWPIPGWWRWLVEPGHPLRAGIAAGCAGSAGAACLYLAARVVSRPVPYIRKIELPGHGGATVIEAGAVDRYLSRALLRSASELRQAKVTLYEVGEGYEALAVVTVRPCDLAALHGRLLAEMRAALRIATGKEIGSLELEVDRFDLKDRGET
jgi:hypothetical protein